MPSLRHLWIIGRYSGICIFEAILGEEDEENLDADLVSGLFSAILALGREIAKRDIESMNFGGQVVLFSTSPAFLFVLMTEKANVEASRDALDNIAQEFRRRYEDIIENFPQGEVSQFAEFGDYMKKFNFHLPRISDRVSFLGQHFDPVEMEERMKDSGRGMKTLMAEQLAKLKATLGNRYKDDDEYEMYY
ncbi:MAG TPA: hypothetical protein VKK79_11165 [Candidatus Lokiarchaeia archaeon]|nr:hypothetical protein [Candidatus Lokiarchaeia archaeon]